MVRRIEKCQIGFNLFSGLSVEEKAVLHMNLNYNLRNGIKYHVIKWGASFRWSSSLYYPMRNSDEMTIRKTHFTLLKDSNHKCPYFVDGSYF